MKQFIVLCSSIVLGIFIYNIIAGDGGNSVTALLENVWRNDIEVRTMVP